MELKVLNFTSPPVRSQMNEAPFQQSYDKIVRGFTQLTSDKYKVTLAELKPEITYWKSELQYTEYQLVSLHQRIARLNHDADIAHEIIGNINHQSTEAETNAATESTLKLRQAEFEFIEMERRKYDTSKHLKDLVDLASDPTKIESMSSHFTTPIEDIAIEAQNTHIATLERNLKLAEAERYTLGNENYQANKIRLRDKIRIEKMQLAKLKEAKLDKISNARLSTVSITVESSPSPFVYRKLDGPINESALLEASLSREANLRRRMAARSIDGFTRESVINDLASGSVSMDTQTYRAVDAASGKKVNFTIIRDVGEQLKKVYGEFKLVPSIANGLINARSVGGMTVMNRLRLAAYSIPAVAGSSLKLMGKTAFYILVPPLTLLGIFTTGAGVALTVFFQILETGEFEENNGVKYVETRDGEDRYILKPLTDTFAYFSQPYFEKLWGDHSELFNQLNNYFISVNAPEATRRYMVLWVLDKMEGVDSKDLINEALLSQTGMILGNNNIQAKFWVQLIMMNYEMLNSYTIILLQQAFRQQYLNTFYIMTEDKQKEFLATKKSEYVIRACQLDELFYILLRHRSPMLDRLVALILISNPDFRGFLPLIEGNEAFYLNTINQYGGFVYYWSVINPRYFFSPEGIEAWDNSMRFTSYLEGGIESQYQSLKNRNYFGVMFDRIRKESINSQGVSSDLSANPGNELINPSRPLTEEEIAHLKSTKFWSDSPQEREEVFKKVRDAIMSGRKMPRDYYDPDNLKKHVEEEALQSSSSPIIAAIVFLFVLIGTYKR